MGCVSSQVPSHNSNFDLLLHFVLRPELCHLLLQDVLDPIRPLAHVLVEEDLDGIELFSVVEIVLDVPLHPSHHLLQLASETLITLLNYPRDVAVRPSVLLRKSIAAVGPHLLVHHYELFRLLVAPRVVVSLLSTLALQFLENVLEHEQRDPSLCHIRTI